MKLTICSSTYNNNETLDLFIDSLILQSYKDWELQICNDEDYHNKPKEFDNYTKDKRIQVEQNNENIGLTNSLIKLIEKLPKDAYIIRMDDDELHSSEYLISIANLFKLGHDLIIFTEHPILGNIIKKIHSRKPQLASLILCLTGNIAKHGGISFTKKCYLNSNGYSKDFKLSQDYNLLIKLLKVSKNPYITSKLNYKPFDIERTSHKISKDRKTMQKIFALNSIIGIFDESSINDNITFYKFIILLIISIPFKITRSIISSFFK